MSIAACGKTEKKEP
ncbi:MAG: hypothetical protein Q4A42_05070, partial [Tissierellia bacterium]|nr:hypothetical protein [Tissierellia bacterium]